MAIYLDHAATSFPKPPEMLTAIREYTENIGANPGRSAHRLSLLASRLVFQTRQALAELFHVADSARIIFTANITEAINLAIFSCLESGGHVVTTRMEHNAVMRPLRFLEKQGKITISMVEANPQGQIDSAKFLSAISPKTKLVVVNHASNVCGTLAPLDEIAQNLPPDVLFLLDTAQTAGVVPIDMQKSRIDLLAFTGHKSLFGPTGIGGLCIRPNLIIQPRKFGGTGSASDSEYQPDFLPDALESGTINMVGIAGLSGSLAFLKATTIEKIAQHEQDLLSYARKKLQNISGITLYPEKNVPQTATFSIRMNNLTSSDLSFRLDRDYQILTRPGLHCAPTAHHTLGTFPQGTTRISIGYFNTRDDIDQLSNALIKISQK